MMGLLLTLHPINITAQDIFAKHALSNNIGKSINVSNAVNVYTASLDTVFTIASYWGRSILIMIRKLALFDI